MQDGLSGGMGAGVVEWLRTVFAAHTSQIFVAGSVWDLEQGDHIERSDHRQRPRRPLDGRAVTAYPSSPGHCSVEGTMQRPIFFHDETELGDEERLVARCLRGEASAWEMMF